MNNIKYSLYIIGLVILSSISLFVAALPEMNQVGRIMFSVFGFSGFAMLTTYISWKINHNKRNQAIPKMENRGPVKRDPSMYYRKKVA